MDKKINIDCKVNHHIQQIDTLNQFINELSFEDSNNINSLKENSFTGDLTSVFKQINDIYDSFSKKIISEVEFNQLIEQIKIDKEQLEESCRKDRINHRVEDYQGMLNIFNNGSQAFLATKEAISQLIAML